MTLGKEDFIWEAAYNLVGNTNGALFISGDPSYENIVWDTKIYTGTIPTKTEVETKAQALLDGEAMRRLREHRDNLLKETDWVVTKASETLPTLKKSALKVSPSKLTSDLYASIVLP